MVGVADALAEGLASPGAPAMSHAQRCAAGHMLACRTSALGGHAEVCPECGTMRYAYNSCRDRSCPKCQSYAREAWVAAQAEGLLDVPHYHAVFTVPAELNALLYCNQRDCYSLMFRCSWETVRTFAADPRHLGASTGATSVLHTWGRTLQYHPHIHMIVPSGGLTAAGTWKHGRKGFFAPVKAMSKVFKGKLIDGLRTLRAAGKLSYCGAAAAFEDEAGFQGLLDACRTKEWVVYCQPPFDGAGGLLAYLGRYVKSMAISDGRIVSAGGGRVAFKYRDTRDGNADKVMELDAAEFARRLLMHVLPRGFQKVRHYGLHSSRSKGTLLPRCRRLTGTREPAPGGPDRAAILRKMLGREPGTCGACGCKVRIIALPSPMRC